MVARSEWDAGWCQVSLCTTYEYYLNATVLLWCYEEGAIMMLILEDKTHRWSNLPKFIQLINGRARSKLRQADTGACTVHWITILSLRGPHYAKIKINVLGTSLVAQWLRIHLPIQATRVRPLVRGDPTCHGATNSVRHNYWACTLDPASHNYWSPRT